MAMSLYLQCERKYARRRKSNDWKRLSHNQVLRYDEQADCYIHRHHSTNTVRIYRDKYVVDTGGWDTSTTWAKIHEYCPVIRTYRPNSALCVTPKLVGWGNYAKGFSQYEYCSPYYDGIELDEDGVPLKPKLVTFIRFDKVKRAAFNEAVRIVRDKLRTRMQVGEWDDAKPAYIPAPAMLLRAFKTLAGESEWIEHDRIAPLFAPSYAEEEDKRKTCSQRFELMVKYVRQSGEMRETYERECYR